MSRLELINYIRQNTKDGFSKKDIRNALFDAGWAAGDIDSAFDVISTRQSRLVTTLAILVLTPLVGFGSAWLYSTYQTDNSVQKSVSSQTGQVAGASSESSEIITQRDIKRISQISDLQAALEKYFQTHQLYPKNLSALVANGQMTAVPVDPKTGDPYLYNPLGDPPLYYSLSFVLELGTDTMQPGFNSVDSETKLNTQDN